MFRSLWPRKSPSARAKQAIELKRDKAMRRLLITRRNQVPGFTRQRALAGTRGHKQAQCKSNVLCLKGGGDA